MVACAFSLALLLRLGFVGSLASSFVSGFVSGLEVGCVYMKSSSSISMAMSLFPFSGDGLVDIV